jgi:hypothetical protein
MSIDITVEGGKSKRLLTAGKYCESDIVVTATGGGVDLPELTNTATAGDLMAGKQMINGEGEAVDGTFTLETEMTEQDSLIEQIKEALKGKTSGGGLHTQEKSVEITENGTMEVLPDDGYALSKVTVNVDVAVGEEGLPKGYKRADYIQFTGAQIVDTGIVCNQDTKIEVVFTREKSAQHYLLGVASSDNTASVTAYFGGNWRFGNKASSKNPVTDANMIYNGILSSSEITITDAKTAISGVNEFETVGSLLLGSCRNSNGSVPAAQFVGKVLLLVMRQGDKQTLKLVPYVSADGVYRFWDAVGQKFHDSITDTPLEGGNL